MAGAEDLHGAGVRRLYVGAQPFCRKSLGKEGRTAAGAASVGAASASGAVAKAAALGMRVGSPVCLDMESYDIAEKACDDGVLAYARSFTRTLRAETYRGGLYGFSSSRGRAISTASNRTDLPGNLWYALWNGQEITTRDWRWDPKLYTGRSRGHQYGVNSGETRGGYAVTVDRNAWDAPVAIVG